jgi:DNA primase small subunit
MDKKDRIGTDLVFDLDADHVPGANLWTYEVQLQKIKQQAIKLIAALEVDLGIPLQNMEVVFSGRRGYHIRVTNKAHLSNAARREIAAAFTGAGLNLSGELLKVDTGGEVLLQLPPNGGWAARARRNLEGFLQHLKTLPEAERSKAIKAIPGIGAKGAQHINPEMYSPGGIWASSAGEQQAWKKLWAYAWDSARIDIDAPVTADIHRIIRCPDSLHGQTGLRAALLPPGALEYFHPLTDAVVFDDHPVTVIPSQDMKFSLRGETFSLHSGDEVDLPKYAAVFAFAGS